MTPTTPRKPMPAPMTVTPGPAGNGPAPLSSAVPEKKKKPVMAIAGAAALVLVIVGAIVIWKIMHPGPPIPTAPTPKIVDYVISEPFKTVPYDTKIKLLAALDNREDEMEKLYRGGKLSEPQMSQAREAAYLGKNFGRMEKFFSLAPGQQRVNYINERVDKMDDVDEPPKTKGPNDEKLPKRDKKWGKATVATFPADVQAQWKEYQKAINDEQDRRKKEKKAAEKAGAATKPAANATKSGGG